MRKKRTNILAHCIRLEPTEKQEKYFRKSAGVQRLVYNEILDTYLKQIELGKFVDFNTIKKEFNKYKYNKYPFLKEVHRDTHSQPISYVQKAVTNHNKNKKFGKPRFKAKGKSRDAFYVANDKFKVDGKILTLPKIGKVRMKEAVRYDGEIVSGVVSRRGNRWYISIMIDVDDEQYHVPRMNNNIRQIGIDVGFITALVISDGRKLDAPKPLAKYQRRLGIRQRSVTRKFNRAKVLEGYNPNQPLPKGTKLKKSKNYLKATKKVNGTHEKIFNIRRDFAHKTTTKLVKQNKIIVIENLNVRGIMRNHHTSKSATDVGIGQYGPMLEYKAKRHGVAIIKADRWFPSTKMCSKCGHVLNRIGLDVREWTCPECQTKHDRDINAAINLKNLVSVFDTLPLAILPDDEESKGNPKLVLLDDLVGKVTPVRYYESASSGSGQEQRNSDQAHP